MSDSKEKLTTLYINESGRASLMETELEEDDYDFPLRQILDNVNKIKRQEFEDAKDKALIFGDVSFSVNFFEKERYIEFIATECENLYEEVSEFFKERKYILNDDTSTIDMICNITKKICLNKKILEISEVMCMTASLVSSVIIEAVVYSLNARYGTAIPEECSKCPVLKVCEKCDDFELAKEYTFLNLQRSSFLMMDLMNTIYEKTLKDLLYSYEEAFFYYNTGMVTHPLRILSEISNFSPDILYYCDEGDKLVFVKSFPIIFRTDHFRCGNNVFLKLMEIDKDEAMRRWAESFESLEDLRESVKDFVLNNLYLTDPKEIEWVTKILNSDEELKKLIKYSKEGENGDND